MSFLCHLLLLLIATATKCQEPGCTDPPGTHGDLRVIGVSCIGGAAGRIEICVSGEWRAVCDDFLWGINDAATVCGQLGFSINTQDASFCRESCLGKSENLKGIRGLMCGMVRTKLTDCEYNIANEESCTEEVGVMCNPSSCLLTYTPPETPTCASATRSSSGPDTTSTTSVTCSTQTTCNCTTDYTTTSPDVTQDTTHPMQDTGELQEGQHSRTDTPLSQGASGEGQQSRTDSCTAIGGGLGALAVVLALTLVGVVLGWVWYCHTNKGYQERANILRMEPGATPPPNQQSPLHLTPDHSFAEYATISEANLSVEQPVGVATTPNPSYGTSLSISRPYPSAEPGSGRVCPNPSYADPHWEGQ